MRDKPRESPVFEFTFTRESVLSLIEVAFKAGCGYGYGRAGGKKHENRYAEFKSEAEAYAPELLEKFLAIGETEQ